MKVMMGNNAMCRVIDIRNVWLMMHDKTMLEIKYVKHVSNLKRNLISLGLFDQIGQSKMLKSYNLRVMNGSKIKMKGTRKNSVYVLDSEVIVGETRISTVKNIDKTKLQHLWIGHMNERDLNELERQCVLGGDKIESIGFCKD